MAGAGHLGRAGTGAGGPGPAGAAGARAGLRRRVRRLPRIDLVLNGPGATARAAVVIPGDHDRRHRGWIRRRGAGRTVVSSAHPRGARMHTHGCRTALLLGATALLLSGCGARPVGGGASTDGAAVHVRYEAVSEGGESGGVLQSQDVIAQGERFRMSVSDATTPGEVYQTVVWDGANMLLIEGEDASRQQDVPAEERPSSFFLRPGDATFDRICPGGTPAGFGPGGGSSGDGLVVPRQRHGRGSGRELADHPGRRDRAAPAQRRRVLTPGGGRGRGRRCRRRRPRSPPTSRRRCAAPRTPSTPRALPCRSGRPTACPVPVAASCSSPTSVTAPPSS